MHIFGIRFILLNLYVWFHVNCAIKHIETILSKNNKKRKPSVIIIHCLHQILVKCLPYLDYKLCFTPERSRSCSQVIDVAQIACWINISWPDGRISLQHDNETCLKSKDGIKLTFEGRCLLNVSLLINEHLGGSYFCVKNFVEQVQEHASTILDGLQWNLVCKSNSSVDPDIFSVQFHSQSSFRVMCPWSYRCVAGLRVSPVLYISSAVYVSGAAIPSIV